MKNTILATTAFVALAACQKPPCDYTLSTVRTDAITQLSSCADSLDPTPVARMPTTGSATYTGFTSGTINSSTINNDTLIADASLTADFSARSVIGTISNVTSSDQGDLGGTLAVTGGLIVGNTILGVDITGGLTGYGGPTTNLAITTTGAGGFAGTNADNIAIATTGTGAVTGSSVVATVTLSTIAAD